MTEEQIREGVHRLAPFYLDVELPYGLSTYVPGLPSRGKTRLKPFIEFVFPALMEFFGGSLKGKRILDVGCNCGGFSLEAVKAGADFVLGIDVVDRYIEQANFIKSALGLQQVEFRRLAIEDVSESLIGQFDITICFGVLYHFENPIFAMRKLAAVTKEMMAVDTKLVRQIPTRKPIWLMSFPPIVTSDSPKVTSELWISKPTCELIPNDAAVRELLKFLGFPKITIVKARKKGPLEFLKIRFRKGTYFAVRQNT